MGCGDKIKNMDIEKRIRELKEEIKLNPGFPRYRKRLEEEINKLTIKKNYAYKQERSNRKIKTNN